MNSRIMMLAITIIASIILIPVITYASNITWSNEHYEAHAGAAYSDPIGGFHYELDINDGPPFPVTSAASMGFNSANAEILDSSMYVYSYGPYVDSPYAENPTRESFARAVFTGSFTAFMPILNFSYNLSHDYAYDFRGDWSLIVRDMKTDSILLDSSLNFGTDESLMIPITVGNNIEVYIHMMVSTNTRNYDDYHESTLNYDIAAVVPEPVSSILFVTGGAILAGRRFIKRKKKHNLTLL